MLKPRLHNIIEKNIHWSQGLHLQIVFIFKQVNRRIQPFLIFFLMSSIVKRVTQSMAKVLAKSLSA